MSALELTDSEKQDVVCVFLPRIIVMAMSNIDGEFYDADIVDQAFSAALESED